MFENIKRWLPFQEKKQDVKLDPELAMKPTRRESALAGDSTFLTLFSNFDQYNPDELTSRKGFDIYRKMLRDDQVKASFQTLINLLISRSWFFEKQNDDPIQDEIIEFFEENINSLLIGSWLQALRTILIGKAQGYSISEKIFRVENVQGVDRWIISKIKQKPYWSFSYRVDDYGNVKELRQDVNGIDKKINPAKFIIFVNYPELDPIWGESDLRAAYRAYWEKDIISRFQNIWIERLAGGFIVAQPQEKATNLTPLENEDFRKILTNITKSTGVKAPQGYKIDVISGTDTDAFENAIMQKNRAINRSVLMPNLLGLSDEKTAGSFAQAKVQLALFMQTVKEQSDTLAEILNEQLFSQLAWWNFGVKDFPRYRFEELTVEQQREAADAWIKATKDGAVVNTFDDESRTRDLLKYPAREQEEGEDDIEEEEEEESEKFAEKESDFSKRLNFAEIEKTFDNLEAAYSQDLARVNKKIFAEFKKRVRVIYKNLPKDKNKIDYNKIAMSFESLPTKKLMAELRAINKENLKFSYRSGRKAGQDSLKEAVIDQPKEIQDKVKFAAATSLPTGCADKKWSVLNFIDGISLEAAENYINAESFMNTKDLTDDEREMVHRVMVEGIKDEKSITQIIEKLDQQIGAKFDTARWETIARTNITNIFTQAQLATYTDPAVKDFVDGLEYSAILDNRTTVFCQTYHGRRFKINNPIWSTITPVNHFNCRSVLIPITILDEWKESRVVKSVQPAPEFR